MSHSSGIQWGVFSAASGVALLVAETAYVYDKSWATYQACQAFILFEYVTLALTLVGKTLLSNEATAALWKHIELIAAVLGVFASSKTGFALSTCVLDTDLSSERGAARDCLDRYDSYASIDGQFGTASVCASLSKNIESPLGGTCPTISYKDEGVGKAVLGAQFGVIVALTVLHFYKYLVIGTPSNSGNTILPLQSLFNLHSTTTKTEPQPITRVPVAPKYARASVYCSKKL